jgi:hypothetical protein
MTEPIVTLVDVLEGIEEVQTIGIGLEDRFLLVASRGDVIYGTGIFYAERTGHEAGIAEKGAICNKRDLTLRSP